MRLLVPILLVPIVGVGLGPVCAGERPGAPLIVINAETLAVGGIGGSVSILAPEDYSLLGTVDLGLSPTVWSSSSDGRTLYLVEGSDESGRLAVVDIAARRLMSTIEIGPGRPQLWLPERETPHLYVFTGGDEGRKARITIIDRATHQLLGAVETARAGQGMLLSLDGRRAFVLHGDSKAGRAEPLLVVVDLVERTVSATHTLPRAAWGMLRSPDGRWVWVIDRGRPAEDPARNVDGALLVFDALTGAPSARLPLGPDPGPVAVDREQGRLYVAGSPPGKPRRGTLHGVTGDGVFGKADLEDRPERIFLAPGAARLLVLGEKSASVVDAGLAGPVRYFPLGMSPFDALFSFDGRRAYVNDFGAWKLKAVDMEGQVAPRELKVGSGGLRWRFSEKNLLTGVDLMALRHDGRILYLGSTRSNEVSGYDTETLQRVAHIRAGNGLYALARSPNDRHLYALAVSQVTVIDTSTHTALHEHKVGSAKEGFLFAKYLAKKPVFSAERDLAFLADGLAVHVFDLRSGGLLRSIGGLPSPQAVLIPATLRAPGDAAESSPSRPPEPGR